MLFLGGAVVLQDTKNRANQLFLLWVVFNIIWMSANYLENVQSFSLVNREAFLRLDLGSGIIAASFILLFIGNYINNKKITRWESIYILPALVLAGLSYSRLLIEKTSIAANGGIQFVEGKLFPVYGAILIGYFLVACIALFRSKQHTTPEVRKQMRPVAIGLFSAVTITLGINLFLQNILSPEVFRIGIYAMLLFIIGVAWSIIKHEFLQVHFVMTELLLLGLFGTLLARTILSRDIADIYINIFSLLVLLILGAALTKQHISLNEITSHLAAVNMQLQEANDGLKEIDKMKSEFISVASHQLRTPISIIRGYLSLIKDGEYGKISPKLAGVLREMNEMNSRMVSLINNLLNLTRMEHRRITYTCESVDVVNIVEETIDGFKLASAKKLKLKLEKTRKINPRCFVDGEKIREVLGNVIDNAIKYSNDGGIVVKIEETNNEELKISVTDSGVGMSADDASHVFEKYYRSKSTEKQSGTGLGLYICEQFITAIGGRIWVDRTELGVGTTFAFTVPHNPRGECMIAGNSEVLMEVQSTNSMV